MCTAIAPLPVRGHSQSLVDGKNYPDLFGPAYSVMVDPPDAASGGDDSKTVADIVRVACVASPETMRRIVVQCAMAQDPAVLTEIQAVLAQLDLGTGGNSVDSKSRVDMATVRNAPQSAGPSASLSPAMGGSHGNPGTGRTSSGFQHRLSRIHRITIARLSANVAMFAR